MFFFGTLNQREWLLDYFLWKGDVFHFLARYDSKLFLFGLLFKAFNNEEKPFLFYNKKEENAFFLDPNEYFLLMRNEYNFLHGSIENWGYGHETKDKFNSFYSVKGPEYKFKELYDKE